MPSKERPIVKHGNYLPGGPGVYVVTRYPKRGAKLRNWSYTCAVWIDWEEIASATIVDSGYIQTTPSPLGRFNDCEQYKVSGVCYREIGYHKGMHIGPYLIDRIPVDVGNPGRHVFTYYVSDAYRINFDMTVTLTSQTQSVVKNNNISQALVNGTWVDRGGDFTIDRFTRPNSLWVIQRPANETGPMPSYPLDAYALGIVKHRVSKSYGDLAREAAESVRLLDINSIAYLKDFFEIGKLAKSLTRVDPVRSVKDIVNRLSGFYLANHYGTRLTVKDTEKIALSLDRIDPSDLTQTCGASHVETITWNNTEYDVEMRLTAKVRSVSDNILHATDSVNAAIDQLTNRIKRIGYEVDILPTAANLWDLIPFSFVVDWFLPIGDNLEYQESKNYLETLPVESVFLSQKIEWSDNYTSFGPTDTLETSLSYKYYKRECTSELPIPPMHVDAPKGASSHWLEASAIILQMIT